MVDGTIVPANIYDALREGCAKKIPVIIGNNAEELPIFGSLLKPGLTQLFVKYTILSKLKKLGATSRQINTLLELYRTAISADDRKAHREYNHLFSDEYFRIPATLFAESQQSAGPNVYFYCFAHQAPKIGAAPHVMELYFVFGNLKTSDVADMMQVTGNDEEVCLSQSMMAAWTTFARTGNPNHPALPEWLPYEPDHRTTMFFNLQSQVKTLPSDPIRSAWMNIVDVTIFK